jgi:hypothetical protein
LGRELTFAKYSGNNSKFSPSVQAPCLFPLSIPSKIGIAECSVNDDPMWECNDSIFKIHNGKYRTGIEEIQEPGSNFTHFKLSPIMFFSSASQRAGLLVGQFKQDLRLKSNIY